ncbi:hypothetical protein EsDP_00004349 [Epichloe bromicola]|uniref:Histidine acid phosphatase n=1 Tax=Epichloe bromicola TaxID=79588 RepID=A0ABQ0CRF9_9HYPO
MQAKLLVALSAAAAAAAADNSSSSKNERILGVYIFHRHGDRTAKAWPPANLTSLGAAEVRSSGAFYRRRYVEPGAPLRIAGVSPDAAAALPQLSVTSPRDAVLRGSASAFLQGLYPPTVEAQPPVPVPVDAVPVDAAAENQGWLQGSSGCDKGVASSNAYLASADYGETLRATEPFYQALLPVINSTFGRDAANFKNAYTIFDYINVAMIHNSSMPSGDLVTDDTLSALRALASTHEWNLAFNASEPVRAIAGSLLAGHVLGSLQAVVDGGGGGGAAAASPPRLSVQFGPYGTFMAFFGLAQLPLASPDFYGICDYASSMVFELYTASSAARPSADDMSVRFLFANGTAAAADRLRPFALFGQDRTSLPWNDFKSAMGRFAVAGTDTRQYCQLCGGTGPACADGSTDSSGGGGSRVSKPVAGVIGALVTLIVILGLQAAVMLFGGLRLVKKSTLAGPRGPETAGGKGQGQ